ncbi:type VI secretion system tip protein VgrG [candidate division KSB1 bacterium]|nr:type VI secretion system tip protein VgrG [candidate division KSB1 bacterium]RQW07349.1 MAG: type VI secretion system tip protein VgrG [candidate division KSB1 bacterium]
MSDERIVPTPAPADLPTVKILIDGQEMNREYNLLSITTLKAVNKIPSALITLMDGDAALEDFPLSNSDDFVPGKEIEVKAGYHANDSTIFKGILVRHALRVRNETPSMLVIECKDPAVRMTTVRKNAYFDGPKDSDIIEEILSAYDVESDVEQTAVEHQEMLQYYASDWDFIVSRAEVNGKLVLVDDGKVSVKAPDTSQEPVLNLLYGSSILELEAEMDARHHYSSITSKSWDFASQEMIEESSDTPNFGEQGNLGAQDLSAVTGEAGFVLQHSGQINDQEIKAWADAKMLRGHLAKIIGRVKCQGFGDIKPGHMLALGGVGERFNGSAFVTAVRHKITQKNWETDIQFGLSEKWFTRQVEIMDEPAAGLLAAVHGLQIGVVSQLQEDPDGEHRILVKMPVVDPAHDGIWARVSTLDAGNNRGSFFRPEIGDEVILGFINDDPRDPIVLGMLNSSAKPAPLEASDDNHEKGFVTRSGIKMIFNDEESSFTLETPNGNTIKVSDDEGSIVLQDENNNIMTLNSDGMTLESGADITIKASGNIALEGTDVEIKAGGQFKAEGSSGAELSTGATAVVKGSLVQIN